jgi:hypothetical protein
MRRLVPAVLVLVLSINAVAATRVDKPREPFFKRFINLVLRAMPTWELQPPKP